MSEAKRLSGAGGTIKIGDLVLYVEPLPIRQEVAFFEDLRRLAKEGMGDFLKPLEPMLERLSKEVKGAPHKAAWMATLIESAGKMESRGDLPGDDAAEGARRSPKGVALEIWYRARRSHPTLQLRELEAVITESNAKDLHWQLREALGSGTGEGGDPKATRSA